ncbi:MAG: GntR family transcriptional regulator [Symbiopectobacterium sp.]
MISYISYVGKKPLPMKESLYRRIARELAQQIFSGQYPVGSLLPTEMALCEHYQVSRPHHTRSITRPDQAEIDYATQGVRHTSG